MFIINTNQIHSIHFYIIHTLIKNKNHQLYGARFARDALHPEPDGVLLPRIERVAGVCQLAVLDLFAGQFAEGL